MELFLLLYITAGAIGFSVTYYIRILKQRPRIIPNWAIALYYVIAAIIMGLNSYKFKNEPELLNNHETIMNITVTEQPE